MDVVCTKLLNLHIIKMSMCSGSVRETVEEQGERARGQAAAGRFRVCLEQWSPGQSRWVGSRDIWEVKLTGPEV